MSFSLFTSTLKIKTHIELTQSPFMGTDCLFVVCVCVVNMCSHPLQLGKVMINYHVENYVML